MQARGQQTDSQEFRLLMLRRRSFILRREKCAQGRGSPSGFRIPLREATFVAGPKRPVRESRPPERFCSYMAMATSILDSEPSSYEEAASQQVWREAM